MRQNLICGQLRGQHKQPVKGGVGSECERFLHTRVRRTRSWSRPIFDLEKVVLHYDAMVEGGVGVHRGLRPPSAEHGEVPLSLPSRATGRTTLTFGRRPSRDRLEADRVEGVHLGQLQALLVEASQSPAEADSWPASMQGRV